MVQLVKIDNSPVFFQPVQLMLNTFPLCKGSGKFPYGTTEIPFVFNLQGGQTRVLHETYHGVFINIQYFIKVDMKRGLLAKDLDKSCEFIVESSVSIGLILCKSIGLFSLCIFLSG